MKRFFLISLLFGSMLVSCQKSGKTSEPPKPPEYLALQQAAERFTPVIGTYGGEMVLSMLSEPVSFNPITATDPVTLALLRHQYEGLVRINGVSLKPEPCLASSWEASPDGLDWTFHIRQGVQWSDSATFSAYDVEFTFNSLVFNDSINPNPSRDAFLIKGKLPRVKAADSLTVTFTLPSPFAPFLRLMTQEILPGHKYSGLARRSRFASALSIQTPPDSMIGTGPFLLEVFVSSQKAVFRKNPLYWRKDSAGNRLPYLDKLEYTLVLDHGTEKTKMLARELDCFSGTGEDIADFQKEDGGAYAVLRCGPASGSNFLVFNQNTGKDEKTGRPFVDPVKRTWFRNESFRKAVAFALDRKRIIDTVFCGYGYPQWSPMSPSEGLFYDSRVAHYEFDTAQVRARLLAAGFRDRNLDGIVEDSSGHSIEFSIITNSGNAVREKTAALVTQDLQRAGFKVRVQSVEFGELIGMIDKPPYAWEAAVIGLSGAVEPNSFASVWRSSGERHMWFPRQKTPSTPWEAKIDSIFEAGCAEIDESKRIAIYGRWQHLAADNLPLIYTVMPERIICISRKFKNINPSVSGGVLHNLEWIFMEKKS
jgi:peptide/nickel transport system substrate-binding protein